MSDAAQPPDDRGSHWWDEFEDLADETLEAGASCEQVHPVVERWFERLMSTEPPVSRPSVEQAVACLTTEILNSAPDDIFQQLLEVVSEDEVAGFVEQMLHIGRAFERALQNGELDDL
jgi:hypothetical protein